MKIKIKFCLKLEVNEPNNNYSGLLIMSRGWFRLPKVFTFLVLQPYHPRNAEIALFTDEHRQEEYSSAVACGSGNINPNINATTVIFDFSEVESDKVPLTWVATNIISEGIHHSKYALQEVGPTATGSRMVFFTKHTWEQDFSEVSDIGKSLAKIFPYNKVS